MRAATIYTLIVILANLTATLFLFGMEVPITVGTLLFGLTYTQRDRMHRMGRPFVYAVILSAAVLNLFVMLALRFLFAEALLGFFVEAGWGLAEQGLVFLVDGETYWRVLLASFTAIVLAEAADTEVYHRLRRRSWLVRVTGSNAVSVPLDSVLFNLIAFAGSPHFTWMVIAKMILWEVVVKYVVGALYALKKPKHIREEERAAKATQ